MSRDSTRVESGSSESSFGATHAWFRTDRESPRELAAATRVVLAAAGEELATPATREAWHGFIERAPRGASWQQFQAWLQSAPVNHSQNFSELRSVFQETGGSFVAESCFSLAERQLQRGPASALTAALLEFCAGDAGTAPRVAELNRVIRGAGGFAAQLEFQAPVLLRELSSPIALGSFGIAGLAARGVSAGVLLRSGRATWQTLVAADAAALAVEVPTLVLSRRAGERIFNGARDSLAAPSLMTEMGQMLLPFGLLRFGGSAWRVLGRNFAESHAVLHGVTGFGLEVMSLAGGHSANLALGIEAANPERNIWVHSLISAAQQRVAGHLLERSGLFRLPTSLEVFLNPRPDLAAPRFDWLDNFGAPALATAAGRGGERVARAARLDSYDPLPEWAKHGIVAMSENQGEGGGSRGSEPPAAKTRVAAAMELLGQRLRQYKATRAGEETVLTRLASSVESLIERVNSRPDLQNDPEFADRVSDLGHELQKLEDINSRAGDNAEKIGLLSSEALDPESARQQTDDLNKEGEARSAFTKAFTSFHAALQSVRTFGLSTERRASLDTSITRLTDLLQSSLGKLPGAERIRTYRARQAQTVDQRNGAILGLAFAPHLDARDSAAAREKRGSGSAVGDDQELESLHRAILGFAASRGKEKVFTQTIDKLAEPLRSDPRSAAAIRVFGEALHALVYKNQNPDQLMDFLRLHEAATPLQNTILEVEALHEGESEIGDGLDMIALEPSAVDYLASGLFVLLRSQGDSARFASWVEAARALRVPGFHPSIAISLFGAAHGRQKLPASLLLEPEATQALLERVGED